MICEPLLRVDESCNALIELRVGARMIMSRNGRALGGEGMIRGLLLPVKQVLRVRWELQGQNKARKLVRRNQRRRVYGRIGLA